MKNDRVLAAAVLAAIVLLVVAVWGRGPERSQPTSTDRPGSAAPSAPGDAEPDPDVAPEPDVAPTPEPDDAPDVAPAALPSVDDLLPKLIDPDPHVRRDARDAFAARRPELAHRFEAACTDVKREGDVRALVRFVAEEAEVAPWLLWERTIRSGARFRRLTCRGLARTEPPTAVGTAYLLVNSRHPDPGVRAAAVSGPGGESLEQFVAALAESPDASGQPESLDLALDVGLAAEVAVAASPRRRGDLALLRLSLIHAAGPETVARAWQWAPEPELLGPVLEALALDTEAGVRAMLPSRPDLAALAAARADLSALLPDLAAIYSGTGGDVDFALEALVAVAPPGPDRAAAEAQLLEVLAADDAPLAARLRVAAAMAQAGPRDAAFWTRVADLAGPDDVDAATAVLLVMTLAPDDPELPAVRPHATALVERAFGHGGLSRSQRMVIRHVHRSFVSPAERTRIDVSEGLDARLAGALDRWAAALLQ